MKTTSPIALIAALLASQTAFAATPDQPAATPAAQGQAPLPGAAAPDQPIGQSSPKPAAGTAESLPGGRLGPAGLFQTQRWTENWTKAPPANAPLLDRIKHIPLTADPSVYLTLGGSERVYFTDWSHTVAGRTANDQNRPVQSRARLYADLHATDYVRAYVELGDNREWGNTAVTGPNQDQFDIYQAFVDVTVPLGKAGHITVRPGRYEMPVGNGKLLGVREGLNMRYTYQGVRASYLLPGHLSIDVFDVRPVNIKPGTFDDGPNHQQLLRGIYVSSPHVLAGFGTDAYFYEFDKQKTTTYEQVGVDHRQNWGLRLWKKAKSFDFDLEGNLQRGHLAGQAIRAYAILFETGYTFADKPLAPRIGLRANLFSGDANASDNKASTFVAANPRLPLISEAAFFGLSNLMDLYPSVTVKPARNLAISAGPDFLWRQHSADGIYVGPAGASFAAYNGSRAIGTDLNLEANWQASRRVSFRLYETYLLASDSAQAHGMKNSNYFGLMSEFKF
ncbi:MAG TPA: alginate export family protein [Novosphingobium sp.]|nr:alginate export family protein [Novosphingobium sp.]